MAKKGPQALVWNPMSPIILRLRQLRERKGWTQTQLAKLAGVRQATISQLESGRVRRVDFDVLEKLGRALGLPALRLLQQVSPEGKGRDLR